jgi:hypothetical protein
MDWRIMGTLGAMLHDANLTAASPAQKARFWPGGDSADSRVQMFDNIFVLPKMGNGYAGFSRIFSYVQGDALSWDNVATNGANPDERRSEYVAAYLSLGAGESVLPIMQTPSTGYGASTSWPVCNGKWDGVNGDPNPSYTCSETNIDAIATAHCSIAANGKPAADLKALQSGDYASVKSGPCGSACPSECGCKSSTNDCVAPWLVDAAVLDGGAVTDGNAGTTDDSGGVVGSSDGGGVNPGDDAGGVASATDGGGSSSAADGGGNGNAPGASSGCGCATPGNSGNEGLPPELLAGGALAALVLVRHRARKR